MSITQIRFNRVSADPSLEEDDILLCEFVDCYNHASYEGWYAVRDFSGNKTGTIRLMKVCDEHVVQLIGWKE